jgi:uncharacterized protein (TIGR02001 family)
MTLMNKTLAGAVAAATFAAVSAVPAYAEVSASAGIANTYLFRGLDLGSGTPAVSGALNFRSHGFYSGIWGTSGDEARGSKYEVTAGYGGEVGNFSYGLGAISYNYPTLANSEFGDYSDAVISLGYGPVSFGAYIPVGKLDSSGDYTYFTLGASYSDFSVLLGMHNKDVAGGGVVGCDVDAGSSKRSCSPVHLDVTYAYNDNLSFTLSQFIADAPFEDKLKFVVSFGIPIGE